MKRILLQWKIITAVAIAAGVLGVMLAAQVGTGTRPGGNAPAVRTIAQVTAPAGAQLITPEDLVKILQAPKGEKPLILNVGPRLLFAQAHIAGSEFIGPGSNPQSLQALRDRVKALPRGKFIVIYCGCCPWSHCPNILPAYKALAELGFTKAKALYIANNLGTDWVYKGYPTARGE